MSTWPSEGVFPTSATYALKTWDFKPYIVIGGQNSAAGTITYSQTGTTVTITHTAHGMTTDFNGGEIYLTQSTGALLSGWFTNWTYVDVDTYTCVSTVSQSTSGNLGTNTAETVFPYSYTVPTSLLSTMVVMFQSQHRKVLTTGTKTMRSYFDSILSTTTSVTTATQWAFINTSNVVFVSNTMYYVSAVFNALQALTSPVFTQSVQLSIATTWAASSPDSVSYVNRS